MARRTTHGCLVRGTRTHEAPAAWAAPAKSLGRGVTSRGRAPAGPVCSGAQNGGWGAEAVEGAVARKRDGRLAARAPPWGEAQTQPAQGRRSAVGAIVDDRARAPGGTGADARVDLEDRLERAIAGEERERLLDPAIDVVVRRRVCRSGRGRIIRTRDRTGMRTTARRTNGHEREEQATQGDRVHSTHHPG